MAIVGHPTFPSSHANASDFDNEKMNICTCAPLTNCLQQPIIRNDENTTNMHLPRQTNKRQPCMLALGEVALSNYHVLQTSTVKWQTRVQAKRTSKKQKSMRIPFFRPKNSADKVVNPHDKTLRQKFVNQSNSMIFDKKRVNIFQKHIVRMNLTYTVFN